ncbi:MAG: nucleotidyl transferase AbiEii/AbiGii toxin family protein [Streptosporangiaceae bacterium]
MTAGDRYATPAAFRRALTDRLKAAAKEGRWTLQQLQRQVAYDRLIERLYLIDDGWIVKGATALLARDIGVRGSLDVDLYREVAREIAEEEVRRAAAADLGDWFRFEIGGCIDIGNHSVRLPVNATIGATTWVEFHVDLVGSDFRMTGRPEDVPPLARGVIPEVEQRGYRAYPLVDHIADKITATYERHGEQRRPSTRYRDLVDLVAIVTGASVEAAAQSAALTSEFDRRGLILPTSFEVPDRALWEPGYEAEARRSLLDTAQTLDEALAVVRPLIDPLLDGTASGSWEPESRRWS